MGDSGLCSMKCAKIFVLAGLRTCRDGKTHRRFWKHFEELTLPVQKLARAKYALWKRDPYHPSL
jgi:hypothetical protein